MTVALVAVSAVVANRNRRRGRRNRSDVVVVVIVDVVVVVVILVLVLRIIISNIVSRRSHESGGCSWCSDFVTIIVRLCGS